MVFVGPRNVDNHGDDVKIATLLSPLQLLALQENKGLQHDIAQNDGEAQERATN